MIETELELRKWGRSLGAVIPAKAVKKEHLKPGQHLKALLSKKTKTNPLKETFGTLKLKRSTEEILRETDREAWDE